MNFPLLTLELRKNRLSAASVVAAFLVTLPVAGLVASVTGMESAKALEAILIGWMLLGSPFAAALIASSVGAQTGSKAESDAEALLPVSPARRAGASLGAALLLLTAVTTVLVVSAWALGALTPFLVSRDPAMNWARPFWEDSGMVPLFLFALVDALLGCWLLSYALGHAVAGGLLGAMLTTATLFAAAVGFGLQLMHAHWGVEVPLLYAELAVATLALKLAAAVLMASWRERGVPLRAPRAAFLAATLLFGPFAAWTAAQWTYASLLGRMKTAEEPLQFSFTATGNKGPVSPAALAAEGRGAAMWNPASGLFFAGSDGVRNLIPEERRSLVEFLFKGGVTSGSVARDEKGTLWATRGDYTFLELWREENGAMKLARREAWRGLPTIERRDRRLFVYFWIEGEREARYVSLENFARLGLKAPQERDPERVIPHSPLSASTADCSPWDRCLRVGSRTWKLPGTPIQFVGSLHPFFAGGKPVYLVAVQLKDGPAAVMCRDDGKVETAWRLGAAPDTYYSPDQFRTLPDGTVYARARGDSIGFLDAKGRPSSLRYGRARPSKEYGDPALVRRFDGRAWLLWGKHLTEVADDGRLLNAAAIPEHRDFRVLQDGVLLEAGGAWLFRGWDGTSRRLTKP